MQLSAFYRVGGLDALFSVCQTFTSTIESVTKVKAEDRTDSAKQELAHAYGGLKVALHLLHPLISAKPVFESGQTQLVTTRDKKDTDPDYFEPHNFLVKLRLAALPLLRDLWEAQWLISAPLSVSKSVVHTVLELTNGENEEVKGDSPAEGAVGGSSAGGTASIPRPAGPDEGRIRQLTDMGFPRSAAERALIRTHNNVSSATELLLAHPFPLPPDPEPIDQEPLTIAAPVDEGDAVPVATDENVQAEASTSSPIIASEDLPPAEPTAPVAEGKSAEEWRKALDEAREPLKAGISRQALLLVDEHSSLIFDLHVAFVRPSSHQQQSVRDLVEDIKEFSPFAYDVQEQPLANRCRLLALVLCATPSSLGEELRGTLMDSLLALLLSNPVSIDVEQPTIPKWLAAHLLVAEALLTLGDEPRAITIPKEDEPIVPESITTGPSFPDARSILFDFCLRLLAIPDLPSDELLSVLRQFVLLTRNHQTACQFAKRDGITLLFRRLKSSAVTGSSSYIAIILRHIVEDSTVLRTVMQQALKRYFAQPRTRVVDATTFVRNCSAMALRDAEIFVDVAQSLCQLGHPSSSSPHVSLKTEPAVDKTSQRLEGDTTDMQVDIPSNANNAGPTESLESIVHFLISELMKTAKNLTEPSLEASPSEPPKSQGAKDEIPAEPLSIMEGHNVPEDASTPDSYHYSCFLMQCLTELLFSYDSCKIAFLSFSLKKRPQTPAKEATNKHRTAALHFLLSDLVSFGTINPQPSPDAKNRIMICNWAMSVIVALCVDSSSAHELKDVSSDLVSVRKFVLEAVSRTIRDLPPSENVDEHYGRLLALADLCHRLLTVRFNSPSRKHDEIPTHIAKVMLEKNFVATLTNALAEVDLNYPNVRGLVASLLRPLEHL